MVNTQKKTPQKQQKQKPQRRLTKNLKDKLRKSLIKDIFDFGGCKEVSTYSLARFLNERTEIYGAVDSLRRKAVENYFYYFNRLTKEKLLTVKEALEQAPEYSSEEDQESDDSKNAKAALLSPEQLRSARFSTPPQRAAAAPEWTPPRLTPVSFPTMSGNQGKHVRAKEPSLIVVRQTHYFLFQNKNTRAMRSSWTLSAQKTTAVF
jgi:hypothetical protein